MNIKDIGVIIAKKPLKENTFIITVFTKNHGLYSGVAKESSKQSYNGLKKLDKKMKECVSAIS